AERAAAAAERARAEAAEKAKREEAEAAKREAQEKAKRNGEKRAADALRVAEETAAKLKLVKLLLDARKEEAPRARLGQMIKEYPKTKAAEEAKKLLDKLR